VLPIQAREIVSPQTKTLTTSNNRASNAYRHSMDEDVTSEKQEAAALVGAAAASVSTRSMSTADGGRSYFVTK